MQSSYTYSRFREKVAPLNPWEDPEDRIGAVDRPHRITLASVAELPFGHGTNGAATGTACSTRFSAAGSSARSMSGSQACRSSSTRTPTSIPAAAIRAISNRSGARSGSQVYGVDIPIFDTTCFYTLNGQPFRNAAGQVVTFQATEIGLGQANIRTFPTTLPHVRFQAHHLLDLGPTKNIRFGDRVRVQVRIEALNVENFTLFGLGNLTTTSNHATFGRLSNIDSSTVMKPRDVQLGVRVTFY